MTYTTLLIFSHHSVGILWALGRNHLLQQGFPHGSDLEQGNRLIGSRKGDKFELDFFFEAKVG